ncbi:MAG: hypothetical protein ACRDVE_20520 [Actinocrinis sp.]
MMRYLNLRGFPAPRLYKADGGRDMELERIDGPTMLKALVRKPWRTAHYARTLADLHRRLHEVPHVDPTPHISDACRAKLDDANMRPVERERLRKLLAGAGADGSTDSGGADEAVSMSTDIDGNA